MSSQQEEKEEKEEKEHKGDTTEVAAVRGEEPSSSSTLAEDGGADVAAVLEAEEESKSGEEDQFTTGRKRRRRDKQSKQADKRKKRESESLVDVSDYPVDVSGVSFMLMGDVDRSLCEGLIYQHGALVSKQVLKRPQYVIAGPAKRTYWWGGRTGPDTKLWADAERAGKTFISQSDFERWMERVQAAKDAAEREAHEADEHLVQLLLEATELPHVLIELVVEYAVEEAPILPVVRRWLKLEQRASDGAHSSTLNPPATGEQIADVESKLKTRLPFALRQLLRLHNGASLQGDAAGMRVFPSTNDLLAPRPNLERFTLPLRWLPWQRSLDAAAMPHRVHRMYFVPPSGPLVATVADAYIYDVPLYVTGESVDQFMEQYVERWRSNIDAGDEKEQQRQEEWKEGESASTATTGAEAGAEDLEGGSQASEPSTPTNTATAAAASEPLSSHARYVAGCRPSALSLPCMQQQWPTLRDTYRRVWRQTQTTQQRGDGQHKVWEVQLSR